MPLMILGFVFVVGLFIYYLATTTSRDDQDETQEHGPVDENIKKEDNIIYLNGDIESMKEKYKNKK